MTSNIIDIIKCYGIMFVHWLNVNLKLAKHKLSLMWSFLKCLECIFLLCQRQCLEWVLKWLWKSFFLLEWGFVTYEADDNGDHTGRLKRDF